MNLKIGLLSTENFGQHVVLPALNIIERSIDDVSLDCVTVIVQNHDRDVSVISDHSGNILYGDLAGVSSTTL
jgi:hypothetical protein